MGLRDVEGAWFLWLTLMCLCPQGEAGARGPPGEPVSSAPVALSAAHVNTYDTPVVLLPVPQGAGADGLDVSSSDIKCRHVSRRGGKRT